MTKQKSSKPTNPDPIHQVSQNAFIREFSEFINRGNVIDLAIGVAVGGAFTAIVTSLVNDIIMPITSLLAGGLDFTNLAIDIPNIFGAESTAHIAYGNFLQNVVNFLLVAFTIFIVVRTLNRINRRNDAAQAAAQAAQDAKTAKAAKKAQDDKDAATKKADDARTAQIAQITKILKSNPPKFGK